MSSLMGVHILRIEVGLIGDSSLLLCCAVTGWNVVVREERSAKSLGIFLELLSAGEVTLCVSEAEGKGKEEAEVGEDDTTDCCGSATSTSTGPLLTERNGLPARGVL
jgi:hypothetical protein